MAIARDVMAAVDLTGCTETCFDGPRVGIGEVAEVADPMSGRLGGNCRANLVRNLQEHKIGLMNADAFDPHASVAKPLLLEIG